VTRFGSGGEGTPLKRPQGVLISRQRGAVRFHSFNEDRSRSLRTFRPSFSGAANTTLFEATRNLEA
jgi:hypothetical protein